MKEIVIVTSNEHKFAEMQAILDIAFERVALDIPEIQSMNIEEVIRAKAEAAFMETQKLVVVEDVEICIRAWNGLPGPFVKWFNQTLTPAGIARLMRSEDDRSATVRAMIDLYDGENHQIFEGVVKGTIAHEPRGENGFGFDSIFLPIDSDKTYAQMSDEEKNSISHRALALSKLKDYF